MIRLNSNHVLGHKFSLSTVAQHSPNTELKVEYTTPRRKYT